ncbi:MAG: phospho-N-acetylmuramoyl-pentapeptide-transferase [Athalassotoga sp.]|uniref:phospho-N-acetylmuramoyl-pentapeptide- transferase n=1 Tax=Athalassotoga sp. TaxID=2022597 RepID=UPI0026A8567D
MSHVIEFVLSFILSLLTLYPFLLFMRRRKIGQHIRPEGPNMHNYKEGTPTMAGAVFIPVAVFVALIFDSSLPSLILAMSTMGFWLIGLADGLIQTFFKRAKGLSGIQKLSLQIFVSLIAYVFVEMINPHTYVLIPFTSFAVNFGWFYPIFTVIFAAGMSNASNLTDGLDGLAGGIFLISSLGLLVFSMLKGLPISMTLSMMGAVLGFLFYNVKPAKIFMGDVGSLALGGYIGIIGMLYGIELWMILIFPVFVIEALSVLMQVTSYKIRKKRIFKMSPIHHHFELSGYSELEVTTGFWISQAIFTAAIVGGILWILL